MTSPLLRDARSPVGGGGVVRRGKNPWTLYVNRLPVPVGEDAVREVFGEYKGNVSFFRRRCGFGFLGKGSDGLLCGGFFGVDHCGEPQV